MEVKIQIPDNCELIKDGNTYIVKKKKQELPRSWEEFCEKHPTQLGEAKIDSACNIYEFEKSTIRRPHSDKNVCTSKEEAEAFLALMQLRQLRKAWVGNWKQPKNESIAGLFYSVSENQVRVAYDTFWTNVVLCFPTRIMAQDFLNCFNYLCEKAKILL